MILRFMLHIWFIVDSQIWLYVPMADHHFGCIIQFPKKHQFPKNINNTGKSCVSE
jgi:hypothetical protein